MKQILLTIALALILAVYANPLQKCEEIDKDVICQCRGYNLTYFPNDRFTSQSRAKVQFSQFENLIRTNCSPYLVTFLCSRYFPPCNPDWPTFNYILPCRDLCEKVRSDCEPILQQFGAKWSQELTCGNFMFMNETEVNGPPCIDTTSISTTDSDAKCQSKEECVDIEHEKGKLASYKTFFPNAVATTQNSASQMLDDILKKNCSLEAEQFYILSHYPPCTETNDTVQLIYPCRQLCRRIKKECEKQFGSKAWPDYMDCRKLSKDACVNNVSHYFVKESPTASTSTVAETATTLPASTPTAKPLESCKAYIETNCGELNKFSDLPKVEFTEYNSTFTNFLNNSCSVWLKPFLCYEEFSAYKSTSSTEHVKPCRNVCRKAEKECSKCFASHGMTWSDHWDCQDFQVKKNCVGLNELGSYSSSQSSKQTSSCPVVDDDKICTP